MAFAESYYQRNRAKVGIKYKAQYRELKEKVHIKLGNRCNNPACHWLNADGSRGCTDLRFLQIDHVFSDGFKERDCTSINFLKRVLKDIEGRYQLLCANCNWIKKVEKHEHHKRKG